MNPAVLALPYGLFRLKCHLKSLSFPSSIPAIKPFSSGIPSPQELAPSPTLDTDETPAMKALQDVPYPSASPDPSIFESLSHEYNGVRLPQAMSSKKSIQSVVLPQSKDQRYHADHVLERLSRSGEFEEAEQVRKELVEMGIPIRPSTAYYRLAWNVIRQRPSPPDRTEKFANWLSLLPSRSSDSRILNLSQISSALLFNTRDLDLNTIAQFGIILSSKGYIRTVGASVIACLTRHADPDVSSRVLDEMIAVNDDYSRTNFAASLNASTRKTKNTIKRLWSVAIRTHCTAGRPEVAFQIVKRAHERDIRLTEFTYEYLLGKLYTDGLDDLAAELRAYPWCRSLDVAKSRLAVDFSKNISSIPPISRKQSMAVNQAIALATLKRSSGSLFPVYADDLVPFFDIYKTDLRGCRPVNELRSRAYRISLTAVSTVLLAEKLHHYRRGQFRHVLWLFDKFFYAIGVPSEEITRRLWKREHYPQHLRIGPWFIPSRIKKISFNLPTKLWPRPYHTALIWSALVHLCRSEDEVFALYDSLLRRSVQFQKSNLDHPYPSHGSSSSILAPAPSPKDRFDAAHFHPFLITFTHLRGAKYGLRVLDDLQDRGIATSAEILCTAATLQARHGDPALALRMLDIIQGLTERDGDEEGAVEMEMEMSAESRVRVEKVKRRQRLHLTAYTGVLRGLIDRRNIVQARQVAELLHSHLGYVEGMDGEGGYGSSGNVRTDAALRYLRRLEVEGLDAIPEGLPYSQVDGYVYPFLKKPNYKLIDTLSAAPVANSD